VPRAVHLDSGLTRDAFGLVMGCAPSMESVRRRQPGGEETIEAAPNIWVDLSGSGVDVGMLEATIEAVGVKRMVWGADLTLCTGWGKLRYLESLGLSKADLERIRSGNARDLFPAGAFEK